ncbi:MAG TPA: ATP-grasp domain-containing protein, partial [Gemmataceae bacterium]|nr:ATP-grasp domain-containing protein [Gemmataceae bacterium]
MPSEGSLLIVGASARAAAFSALRAGLNPECADLFADADLAARCAVRRVDPNDYPRGFASLPLLESSGPWLYTGGLENHPDVIEAMAERRQPLWGNPAPVLRRVRSPFEVRAALRGAGLPCPEVWQGEAAPPPDGHWVVKALAGAGGSGVRLWGASARSLPRRPAYWQEFIEGESCAAVYVGDGETATLLGVTRQLVGEAWLYANRFAYCGSVGPLPLGTAARRAFEDIGAALARAFGLRGLFGVDCVSRDGVPYPVEVNPRYTASVEVLEYATRTAALALHRRAFESEAAVPPPGRVSSAVVGKAVLFARRPFRFPARGPWRHAVGR